ncbi:ATP-binding protein [Kitasatospora sp. SUK 42]|uniref:ATP-binding protein n=1 Tax=Kitasatospora sp. SUK 42 TaxID=1588882 RepID=UPI0018C97016|nr:ATP-binding protein [Kitasatospora sp. SUK 42]MBV2151442.1 ATP-binding protein [Kitasatospora sp. SUK 42]
MTTEAPTRTEPLARPTVAKLPYKPQSASVARTLVRRKLADWELERLADEAELVVTELVSNAVKTGCLTTMRVSIAQVTNQAGHAVRISVRDGSRALPVLISAAHDAESGRGLALVDRLAVIWGIDLEPHGKTMCADLHVEQA